MKKLIIIIEIIILILLIYIAIPKARAEEFTAMDNIPIPYTEHYIMSGTAYTDHQDCVNKVWNDGITSTGIKVGEGIVAINIDIDSNGNPQVNSFLKIGQIIYVKGQFIEGLFRVKILEPTEEYKEYLGKGNLEEHHAGQETKTKFKVKTNAEYKFKGYFDCGCNAGFKSGIVLDPFMGAGTTALVALKQRKRFVGIEIKQEYIDMAKKRIKRVQPNLF